MNRQLSMFGKTMAGYYNTVPVETAQAVEYNDKALKQQARVLKLFKEHPTADFTPYEVWLRLGQQWPKGSIQRAITNLTIDGELVMMGKEHRRDGEFKGVKTNVWRLKREP